MIRISCVSSCVRRVHCMYCTHAMRQSGSSQVSIQTQSLAFESSQSWLPLLRPSILLAARMLSRSSGNHDWLLSNASDCVWMETGLQPLLSRVSAPARHMSSYPVSRPTSPTQTPPTFYPPVLNHLTKLPSTRLVETGLYQCRKLHMTLRSYQQQIKTSSF